MQISIFPSISENLNEVLDSMYHREVTEGESIITQGADGDNFYVIERFVQMDMLKLKMQDLLPFLSLRS